MGGPELSGVVPTPYHTLSLGIAGRREPQSRGRARRRKSTATAAGSYAHIERTDAASAPPHSAKQTRRGEELESEFGQNPDRSYVGVSVTIEPQHIFAIANRAVVDLYSTGAGRPTSAIRPQLHAAGDGRVSA